MRKTQGLTHQIDFFIAEIERRTCLGDVLLFYASRVKFLPHFIVFL